MNKVGELNVLISIKIIYIYIYIYFHKVHSTNYHTVLLSQYTTSLLLCKSQTYKYPSLSNVTPHGTLN